MKGSVIAGAALLMFATSCNKEDDSLPPPQESEALIAEEEAVEAIRMAILPESGGFIEQTQQALTQLDDGNNKQEDYECGEEYGAEYSYEGGNGQISFDLDLVWSWILDCGDDDIADSADFDLDSAYNYDGPNLASSGATSAVINIQNIGDRQGTYVINEDYLSTGSQQSKVRNRNNYESTMQFTTEDLTILKSNYNITGGTMEISFLGEVDNGNMYSYSASLEFTGNQTATLTMGSGNTYYLAW